MLERSIGVCRIVVGRTGLLMMIHRRKGRGGIVVIGDTVAERAFMGEVISQGQGECVQTRNGEPVIGDVGMLDTRLAINPK